MHASPVEHRVREDNEAGVIAFARGLLSVGIGAGGSTRMARARTRRHFNVAARSVVSAGQAKLALSM
jgi:hypothetical protein